MSTRQLFATATVGATLAGLTLMQALSAGTPPPPSTASRRNAPAQVAAEGRVVTYPGADVKVAAEWSGRVTRVLAVEGQSVRKGDLLLETDGSEIAAAQAAAQARAAEAEADIRLAETSRDRFTKLLAEGVVAQADLDRTVRDLENATARKLSAEADAKRQDASLRKTRVYAPIAGTVITRDVDAGESVNAGQVAFTLADLSRLRVDAEADESDAGRLAVGGRAQISSNAFPGQSWNGTVEEVADMVVAELS